MFTLPIGWMPDVPMRRIIGHWTAGGHKANDTDRRAYHVLVEGDANVVRGGPSIALNSGKIKPGYAAHTLNCNTDSIGASMCGMAGAVERPFDAGRAPLTRVQWDRFVEVIAELAGRYSIPVTPKTVLFHAEVQANLGIAQRNKWDVARLPFDPSTVGARAIGDRLRREVTAKLGRVPAEAPDPVPAGGVGRVTAASLNFRRSPDGEITGDLPGGTEVEIIGQDGDWLNVRSPAGYDGWVHRDHVELVDGPPAEEPTKPDPVRTIIAGIRQQLDALEAAL